MSPEIACLLGTKSPPPPPPLNITGLKGEQQGSQAVVLPQIRSFPGPRGAHRRGSSGWGVGKGFLRISCHAPMLFWNFFKKTWELSVSDSCPSQLQAPCQHFCSLVLSALSAC